MAFKSKNWTDRKTEYPNRRLLTKEDGSTELVTVSREEGIVSEEGDAFSAENMNDLEQRIANDSLRTSEEIISLDKDVQQVTGDFEQFTSRMDELTIRDMGQMDVEFVNGTYIFETTDLAKEAGFTQLRAAIVNGYSDQYFATAVPDADPAHIKILVKCISNAELTGTHRISIILILHQLLPGIVVG